MQLFMRLAALIGVLIIVGSGISKCSMDDKPVAKDEPPVKSVPTNPAPDESTSTPTQAAPRIADGASGDELGEPGKRRSAKVKMLEEEIRAPRLEDALGQHDSSVLSIVPAKGFKDGVAGVFKKYHLHVNQNSSVDCFPGVKVRGESRDGCLIGIYLSRQRASNRYSELAGWSAVWFRGVDDPSFRPVSPFAEHLSNADDSMLRIGGFMEISDRP